LSNAPGEGTDDSANGQNDEHLQEKRNGQLRTVMICVRNSDKQ